MILNLIYKIFALKYRNHFIFVTVVLIFQTWVSYPKNIKIQDENGFVLANDRVPNILISTDSPQNNISTILNALLTYREERNVIEEIFGKSIKSLICYHQ